MKHKYFEHIKFFIDGDNFSIQTTDILDGNKSTAIIQEAYIYADKNKNTLLYSYEGKIYKTGEEAIAAYELEAGK